jgi:4-hydroxybenzoate polyprenyltransferase
MSGERRTLADGLRYGLRLTRVRDLWDKILHLTACVVVLWLHAGRAGASASALVLCLAGFALLLMGGYAANDFADFDKDRVAGGGQRGASFRRGHSLAAALSTLALGSLLIVATAPGFRARAIVAAALLVGLSYSLPPFRFKERGLWGVVVGAFAQRPALFLVWAAGLGSWNALAAVLAAWLFFIGMVGMLGHQVLDRERDRAGRVRTFVFLRGRRLALGLAALCAAAAGIATLAPLAFLPFERAAPAVVTLILMSAASALKSAYAARKIGPSRSD